MGCSNVKKVIIFILILATAKFLFEWRQHSVDASLNPEVIAHPVYAEVHMSLGARDRSFEQVWLAKTVDQMDCKKYSQETLRHLFEGQASDNGENWQVQSSECKAELAPRYAKLFDNEPTFLTYLSMARGDRHEREVRLIYWGLSLEESDRVCDGVSKLQSSSKGAVTCIRALRS